MATMISQASSPRMTFEEFLEWSGEDTWAEWVDGEVHFLMSASLRHQLIMKFLLVILELFAKAQDAGTVLSPPFAMKIGPNLRGREPDILFVSKGNEARLQRNYLDGPADMVVEIVSPESRIRDTQTKLAEYEQGGVREYWLLDPDNRQATFYRLNAQHRFVEVALDADGRFHSEVLPCFWLEADWLWQELLPDPLSVLKTLGLLSNT